MKTKLIINADDFGLCTGINRAVIQACSQGVLTSATIMADMPAAEQAVKLAKENTNLGVGIHLNLTEAKPVSNDKKIDPLLNKKGQFALAPAKLAMKSLISTALRNAIEIELTAQIQWLIYRGIKPTHMDSHKHIHAFPSIYTIVTALAERFNIPAIRWPYEPKGFWGSEGPYPERDGKTRAAIVTTMARINRRQNNKFIKNDLFLGLALTGRIDRRFWKMVAENAPPGVLEVMTHPGSGLSEGLNPAKMSLIEQRKVELEALCSEEVKKVLTDGRIELTHYGKL